VSDLDIELDRQRPSIQHNPTTHSIFQLNTNQMLHFAVEMSHLHHQHHTRRGVIIQLVAGVADRERDRAGSLHEKQAHSDLLDGRRLGVMAHAGSVARAAAETAASQGPSADLAAWARARTPRATPT